MKAMKKITMGQFTMVSLLIALLFLFGCAKTTQTQVKKADLETIALAVKGMT